METQSINDRALDRVRKMLALANDASAAEGERDNALRMAHSTLAKHNLSLVDVDNMTTSEKRTSLELETMCWPWMRSTAFGIAELFFCKYFFSRVRKNYIKHHFIGRLSNATTASDLSRYVIASIVKEAAKAKRETPYAGSDFVVSFCKGAAHKVHHRCIELRTEAERASQVTPTVTSTGTALVLASVYSAEATANNDYLKNTLQIQLKTSASRERQSSRDGYNAGAAFGARVNLSCQLNDASGVAQLS